MWHVLGTEELHKQFWWGKPEENRPLGRPTHRWPITWNFSLVDECHSLWAGVGKNDAHATVAGDTWACSCRNRGRPHRDVRSECSTTCNIRRKKSEVLLGRILHPVWSAWALLPAERCQWPCREGGAVLSRFLWVYESWMPHIENWNMEVQKILPRLQRGTNLHKKSFTTTCM
jgi:hypothetical protein